MNRKLKVLIVEDNDEIRNLLDESFKIPGHTTVTARDGLEATLRVDSESFDAIITDVRMPRLDGLQFAANVKNSRMNAHVPLFLVSGDADRKYS